MAAKPLPAALQASAPSRLRDRITWLIARNYARSNGLLQEGLSASGTGLRGYHYRLLAALEEGGPCSQADLGRSTAVDRSDVANVLAELEQRKLVKRRIDPTNQRRNIVSITPGGRDQLAALDTVLDEIQQQVLAPLSETERRQLDRLMRKLLYA